MAEFAFGQSPYIYGLHEPGGEWLMEKEGKKGWIVFAERVFHDPNDQQGADYSQWANRGFGILVRINHDYYPGGTIPQPEHYDDFAQRVRNFVQNSRGGHIWAIGNEMNHAQERPAEQMITPQLYAQCYKKCWDQVHNLPDHENDQVAIGAVAPWNNTTAYPGNESGDWVKYYADILRAVAALGCPVDAITLHAYTHGHDPSLVFSEQKMDPPFQNYRYHFRCYRDFMEATPSEFRNLPVYITEADEDEEWENVNRGWVQNAYKEINDWNSVSGNQQIRALILYRWPRFDKWGIEGKGGVIDDFQAAMAHGYRWDAVTGPISEPAVSRPKIGRLEGASNDEVVREEDQLNFRHYVTAFADLITSPYTKPPLTIGIFGSWGMGKSFLLKHIKYELEDRKNAEKSEEGKKDTPIGCICSWGQVWRRFKPPSAGAVQAHRRMPFVSTGTVPETGTSALAPDAKCTPPIKRNEESSPQEARTINPLVHIVEFNAWEYSANEAIWPGLVRKIMQTVEKKIPRHVRNPLWNAEFRGRAWRNFKSKVRQERVRFVVFAVAAAIVAGMVALAVWRLGGGIAALWSALGVLGISGLAGFTQEVYAAISEPLSPWITALFQEDSEYGKPIDYMSRIRDDLELLGKELGSARVLVLIDDLDRCEPDKAVEVLQAIKLLLDFEQFIVCMGIDARVITRAVEKHYEGLLGPAKASGYEYLDKIIQIPFRIPEPSPDEIKEFINKQMDKPAPPPGEQDKGGKPSESPLSRGHSGPSSLLDAEGAADQEPLPIQGTEEPPQLDEAQPAAFEYDELVAFQNLVRFLRRNPRHIKRLINVYRLVRTLARIKRQPIILDNPVMTIRWLVLYAQWPYTAYAMLCHLDEMLEDKAEGKLSEWPPEDPLVYLLDQVRESLVPDMRNRLDDDPDLLRQLLALEDGRLTWDQLPIVRQYTINFNPAIEAELPSEAPGTQAEAEGRGANASKAKERAPSIKSPGSKPPASST